MRIEAKAKDAARQKARQSRPATPAQKQLAAPQAATPVSIPTKFQLPAPPVASTKKESPAPQRPATAATGSKQLPAPQGAKPITIPTKLQLPAPKAAEGAFSKNQVLAPQRAAATAAGNSQLPAPPANPILVPTKFQLPAPPKASTAAQSHAPSSSSLVQGLEEKKKRYAALLAEKAKRESESRTSAPTAAHSPLSQPSASTQKQLPATESRTSISKTKAKIKEELKEGNKKKVEAPKVPWSGSKRI